MAAAANRGVIGGCGKSEARVAAGVANPGTSCDGGPLIAGGTGSAPPGASAAAAAAMVDDDSRYHFCIFHLGVAD